jgi:FKBP-type peptidyl-prolyl cis-trans isomerase FkpA
MTKNKKLIFFGLLAVAVVVGAGATFFILNNKKEANSETAVNGTEKVASLNMQQSDTVPLGGSSDNSGSESSLKVNESQPGNPSSLGSGTPRSTGSNNSSSSGSSGNSSSSSAPGPESFKEYEKYKDSQSALFGDVQQGTGSEATVGKKVAVYYKGWLTNGQLFDQSVNSTFVFKLGDRQVIPGWEQTIPGMKIGGIRRIIVPPSVGYGAQGQGPIPGNSVLVFDVQLVAVE